MEIIGAVVQQFSITAVACEIARREAQGNRIGWQKEDRERGGNLIIFIIDLNDDGGWDLRGERGSWIEMIEPTRRTSFRRRNDLMLLPFKCWWLKRTRFLFFSRGCKLTSPFAHLCMTKWWIQFIFMSFRLTTQFAYATDLIVYKIFALYLSLFRRLPAHHFGRIIKRVSFGSSLTWRWKGLYFGPCHCLGLWWIDAPHLKS